MPDAWPVVTKAVVVAPKVAELVYKANLMLSAPFVRLCPSTRSSCLKLVHIADVIAIIAPSIFWPCLHGLVLLTNLNKSYF